MTQQHGSPFKKHFSTFTSLVLFLGSVPSPAQQRVHSGAPLYFETQVDKKSKNKKQPVKIKVKDTETGKRASLMLTPSDLNPDLMNGYFVLQFDESKGVDLHKLEFFLNKKKMVPFTPGPNKKNLNRIFLFPSAESSANFVEKFYAEGDADSYPSNGNGQIGQSEKKPEAVKTEKPKPAPPTTAKKIIEMEEEKYVEPVIKTPPPPVVAVAPPTEIPKEIPKAEKLQEKSEEQQRLENEAKLNLEMIEAQKRAARLEQLAKMKEEEKKARKDKARKLAEKALEAYKRNSYDEAVKLFAEATNLDPESDDYYFQYGVALYKLDKYRKSLATLAMAEGSSTNKTELTYFKALNHLKLEEYDSALEEFSYVEDENDENLSGTAAFFAGNITFRQEKYAEARKHLEYAIDKSKDPKIDQQAEDLIEEIDRVEAFIAKTKEIFRYSVTAGFGYDQNVLNVATQNPSNAEAYRANYAGNFLYRLIYDYRNELSADFNLNYMYSYDSNFQANPTVQASDPFIASVGLPYHRQSLLFKRAITWGLTPQYQSIIMNIDGTVSKEILNSTVLKFDANFMYNSAWMSAYRAEYSIDTSSLPASTSADVLSGHKITAGMTQTRLLDQRGTNTWNYSFDYTTNQSEGKNYQYNKWAVGVGYGDKVFKDHDGSVKLDYSNQDYANASIPRNDSVLALTATAGKEYWPSTNVNYNFTYNINSSNISTYQYNKFAFTVSLTYSGSKKRK